MTEHYLTEAQLQCFKEKLLCWKADLVRSSQAVMKQLREINLNEPDMIDQASAAFETAEMLRNKERNQNLINEIDHALQRIEDKTYGYCEETGEPIGIGRLEVHLVATLCLEEQERLERHKRMYATTGERDTFA